MPTILPAPLETHTALNSEMRDAFNVGLLQRSWSLQPSASHESKVMFSTGLRRCRLCDPRREDILSALQSNNKL
jgi:hypothetical protein